MEPDPPGLNELPPEVRSALERFLKPHERVLWVGQPGPKPSSPFGRLLSSFWVMLGFKILCVAPIVIGLKGMISAIRLWVPGATFPLIAQLVPCGLLTLVGVWFLVVFWSCRVHGDQSLTTTVYVVTTSRVLGFIKDPDEPYGSWHIWLTQVEVDLGKLDPDGTADILFPGSKTRGHTFERQAMFSRVRDAELVAALILDAAEDPDAPEPDDAPAASTPS